MPKGVVMAVLFAAAIVPRQSRAQAPAVAPADDDDAGDTDDAPLNPGVDATALEQRLAQSEIGRASCRERV